MLEKHCFALHVVRALTAFVFLFQMSAMSAEDPSCPSGVLLHMKPIIVPCFKIDQRLEEDQMAFAAAINHLGKSASGTFKGLRQPMHD